MNDKPNDLISFDEAVRLTHEIADDIKRRREEARQREHDDCQEIYDYIDAQDAKNKRKTIKAKVVWRKFVKPTGFYDDYLLIEDC